jgi:hypothetical protein
MNIKNKVANTDLVVGICGHRWVRESKDLLNVIDKVVEKITQTYSYQNLKVLSPLAEGADRIVAKRILSLSNAHLVALLPFPMQEYLDDFSTSESEGEFRELYDRSDQVIALQSSQVREEAYAALGRSLLEHSDILIAIWDGKPANGRGGTAEIVLEARERGLPLAWILHKQPGSIESDVIPPEEAQESVIFERFPSQKPMSEAEN